jgi:signal transduction histidine kinase/CheY-like chemotaxis protein
VNGESQGVASLYGDALRNHLREASEDSLHRAYEVGRVALSMRLGVVDLVLAHQAVLSDILAESGSLASQALIAPASDFLAEALSPFEMMLRGYEEANTRLATSNADLTLAHAELAAAHEALKAEVAERERAEAELVHAQKLQAVGLLAGGVAHHFNNLLTVVLGNLQLARRHIADGQDIERFLVSAIHGAERGAEVVRQLLTFSRQQVLATQVVDLAAWLDRMKSLLAGALRGDIVVEVEAPSGVSPIRIDPGQLELALLNLAVNASDAMPAGGVLRISAADRSVDDPRLGLHGAYVVIEVSDTGEGVAPENLARIFEPFFTTKSRGPGAGLGLSQVHGFVHQSGGALDVESAVGTGTTFRIYLPMASEAVPAGDADPAARHVHHASGHVLVVDDDVEVAELAGELLEGCGYAVKRANRATAALDLLKAGEPVDLVFSDIIMPGGMNGVELAEEILRRYPSLPILLGTGFSEAIPQASASRLPVISKPYDAHALCEQVGELLRRRAR